MSQLTQELSLLAPQFIVNEYTVLVVPATQFQQLVPYNPLRWGIIFAQTTVEPGQVNITTQQQGNAVSIPGFQLPANGVIAFSYRDFGGLVQQAWYCSPVGGNATVMVIEITLQQ